MPLLATRLRRGISWLAVSGLPVTPVRRRWPRWRLSLPLDVSGVFVVAAECSLLTLGGHWHYNGGGRAETLHGGREADARAVDD